MFFYKITFVWMVYFSSAMATQCPVFVNSDAYQQLQGQDTEFCYAYIKVSLGRDDAYTWCRSKFKGYLARISEVDELNEVARNLQKANTNSIWIDIKCDVAKENCTWSDGRFIGDAMLGERMGAMSTTCGALMDSADGTSYVQWSTIGCSLHHQFICQAPKIISGDESCGAHSFIYKGRCFHLFQTAQTKDTATRQCRERYGQLAKLDSQELIIAAANYLSISAQLNYDDKIWVSSVSEKSPGSSKGIYLTQKRKGTKLLDSYTGWYLRESTSGSKEAFALCEVEISSATEAINVITEAHLINRTKVTGRENPTFEQPVDGAIIVPALVVSIFLCVLLICVAILCFKPNCCSNLELCRRVDRWLMFRGKNHNKNRRSTRSATGTSEFQSQNTRRYDRSSRSDHSYFQIVGPLNENLYATIDSNVVESDQGYAQIDNQHHHQHHRFISAHKSPLSSKGANYEPVAHVYPATHLSSTQTSATKKKPLKLSLLKEDQSSSRDAAENSNIDLSHHVNYATLQLSADEDVLAADSVHYATLLLYDEDEKYARDETTL